MSEKGQLRWRCRRGMRELDQAMLSYLDNDYDTASEAEKMDFKALLELQEPELYGFLCGTYKDARYQYIIDKITRNLVSKRQPL